MEAINATYIRTELGIAQARDEILAAPALGVDTETTGLDPLKDKLRLVQVATSVSRCFIFDMQALAPAELGFLWGVFANPGVVKIFQNAKFDIKFLMAHTPADAFPTIFDTYLASVLIACGDDSVRHSLADLAAGYAGIELDKTEQKGGFDAPELSESKLAYAARDACVLFPIMAAQRQFLRTLDLEQVALLEFDCAEAVADLELRGIYLNQEQWEKRIERQQAGLIDLSGQLSNHFRDVVPTSLFGEVDIDLESPIQLLPALKKLGVPLTDTTLEGKIKPYAKQFPVIADLLAYRETSTALKMFGPEYIRFIHPADGRIHAEFRQIGTPTGRFTCKYPNLQQITAEEEYRGAFQAQGDDRRLIIADYSMIELRIMAHFSRDEKMLWAFQNNIDLHQYTGSQSFGLPLEAAAKGTEQRQVGKMQNFATTYGTGKYRMAEISGLTPEASDKLIKAFWDLYSGLDAYMKDAGRRAVEEREVHSFSGRTWRLDYDPTNHKSIAAVERLGRNFPIQATCSDIVKRALYLMRNKFRGKNAGLVNAVHDEAVVEAPVSYLEESKEIVHNSMMAAAEEVLVLVPAKVDINVSSKWQK